MTKTIVVRGFISFSCILVLGVAGCNSSSSNDGGGQSMDSLAGQVDAANAQKRQDEAAAAAKTAADQKAAEAAAAAAANPAAPERHAVGSRTQMEDRGYFSAIGSARRHVMNVADNISWIQGVRSFKAEEGRKPKDNNEFMNVVVKRYELQLPRIEADEEYLYDPNGESDGDFGLLYVVKKETPADSGGTPPPGPPAPGQR